jgi:hypothetical protein
VFDLAEAPEIQGKAFPGPLQQRVVLSKATVNIGNESYLVVLEMVQPFNFSYDASTGRISFLAPAVNSSGYVSVAISGSDGLQGVSSESLYFSDACPSAGMYGSGSACRPCPKGSYCPGGFRAWPLPGYWRDPSDESSYVVLACTLPAIPYPDPKAAELYPLVAAGMPRCIGGKDSLCRPDFAGRLCSTCAAGFYKSGNKCKLCLPSSVLDAKVAVIIYVVVFDLVILFGHRDVAGVIVGVIGRLRDFYAVGRMSSAGLPQYIQDLYATLAIFVLDLYTLTQRSDFRGPACYLFALLATPRRSCLQRVPQAGLSRGAKV